MRVHTCLQGAGLAAAGEHPGYAQLNKCLQRLWVRG